MTFTVTIDSISAQGPGFGASLVPVPNTTETATGTIIDDDDLGLTVSNVTFQEQPGSPPTTIQVPIYLNSATTNAVVSASILSLTFNYFITEAFLAR